MRPAAVLLFLGWFAACGGDIEKENVATTSDAGTPPTSDGATPTLDAHAIDADTGTSPTDSGGDRPCTKNADCNGGTCFEGLCMCELPKYVQKDGRCGDQAPPDCMAAAGTCRQNPAECAAGELEADVDTNMSCGDFVAAVCCFAAPSCKTTVDFVCCGASTTPYEPTCVNGWRSCNGGGPTPKLRSQGCP